MRLLAVFATALFLAAPAAAAPVPLPAAPGCPLFPETNVWNKPVGKLPLRSNSRKVVRAIGARLPVHADFGSGLWEGAPIGIPITVVDSSQATSAVDFDYDDESDAGPYPIPNGVAIEGGDDSDGDRHAIIVDSDSCTLYELFALYPVAVERGLGRDLEPDLERAAASRAGRRPTPPACRSSPASSATRRSPRGHIDHAIRFTVSRSQARLRLPGTALRLEPDEQGTAADGPAPAAPCELSGVRASRTRPTSSSRRSSATG